MPVSMYLKIIMVLILILVGLINPVSWIKLIRKLLKLPLKYFIINPESKIHKSLIINYLNNPKVLILNIKNLTYIYNHLGNIPVNIIMALSLL